MPPPPAAPRLAFHRLRARLAEHFAAHGAVGTSLRQASLGGPELRVYVGLKADFAVIH